MSAGAADSGAGTRSTTVWIAVGLVAAVLASYSRVGSFAFVSYDDPDYVLDNPWVKRGFTWEGVRWACTTAHASNWHPLTWLAHMLDVQLFGLEPAGHHWTSVCLHAANAALCFLALRALTRTLWPSALVAALFALHPLRVESVAWISERKDVLAGFFFFLVLLVYARYARAPSVGRYACVLGIFALGLLAKPMLVTAPALLLLLDVWPLRRFSSVSTSLAGQGANGVGSARRLLLEKAPLLVLSALSCWIAVQSQRLGGSLYPLETIPLGARIANAPLAVLRYLAHSAWPSGLAYFYPHPALVAPEARPWNLPALGALFLVLALSAAALRAWRRRPALFVGWFWFLGMLVPVMGLVQVGEQALADRYAYVPLIGLQLALVFGISEGVRFRRPALLSCAAGVALVCLAAATYAQTAYWRDSETLYRRALLVTERNYPAHVGLANQLAEGGDVEAAREHYELALQIRPSYAPALYSLALLEQEQRNSERAIELYRRTIQALPELAAAHLNLGGLLAQRNELVDAAVEFEAVLALQPEQPDAHFNLAQLLLVHGQMQSAIEHLEAVVRVRGDAFAAWEKLGEAYEALGRHAQALRALSQAVREPTRWSAASTLAWLLATAGEDELRDPQRALELARRAVQASERKDFGALEALAAAWAENGDFEQAAEVQEEALAEIAPGRQASARARLELYRSGRPFRHAH